MVSVQGTLFCWSQRDWARGTSNGCDSHGGGRGTRQRPAPSEQYEIKRHHLRARPLGPGAFELVDKSGQTVAAWNTPEGMGTEEVTRWCDAIEDAQRDTYIGQTPKEDVSEGFGKLYADRAPQQMFL